MTPDIRYYTIEEVADLLGVTYQLIYRLVRSGELPAVRVGRVSRITGNDLDAYLENAKTTRSSGGGTCAACGKAYKSDLSLPALARRLEIPAHHLSQVINEGLGRSFSDLINGYRVDEAKRLLISEEHRAQSVLEIALAVGFNSQAAFYRAFKKFADSKMSPAQYRKAHRARQ